MTDWSMCRIALLTLPLAITACSAEQQKPETCSKPPQNEKLVLRNLLEVFPRCWTRKELMNKGVFIERKDDFKGLRFEWRACDMHANGFRREIGQPLATSRNERVHAESWGIEDEKKFARINYSWNFTLSDKNDLLDTWANSVVLAQWHSNPSPNDIDLKGASPVIGLNYRSDEKAKGSGTLTLTMKVLAKTGVCPAEKLKNHSNYCILYLASYPIKEDKKNSVEIDVTWDKPDVVGKVSAKVNEKHMTAFSGHAFGNGPTYSVPNKQSANPNQFKIGLYVLARDKKMEMLALDKNEDEQKYPEFCNAPGKIVYSVSDLKIAAFEAK